MRDYWVEHPAKWVRHHVAAREGLFSPDLNDSMPNASSLAGRRISYMTDEMGNTKEVHDDWRRPYDLESFDGQLCVSVGPGTDPTHGFLLAELGFRRPRGGFRAELAGNTQPRPRRAPPTATRRAAMASGAFRGVFPSQKLARNFSEHPKKFQESARCTPHLTAHRTPHTALPGFTLTWHESLEYLDDGVVTTMIESCPPANHAVAL